MTSKIVVKKSSFQCPLLEDEAQISLRYIEKRSSRPEQSVTLIGPTDLECDSYLECGICTHRGAASTPDWVGKCEHPFFSAKRKAK